MSHTCTPFYVLSSNLSSLAHLTPLTPKMKVTRSLVTRNEERVMGISCWMLLWLEQSVEIPETAFNEIVCWHFTETATTIKQDNH